MNRRRDRRRFQARKRPRSRASALRARQVSGQSAWELVHPPCARQRAEDMEEVRRMIELGETEVAVDELRWLLNDCGDFIEAHRLLGELALAEGDLRLARGHFGYAYEIALAAMERAGRGALFPYERPANRAFFESAKGLAYCLAELGKIDLAQDVLNRMLALDPADPLGAADMLASLSRRA